MKALLATVFLFLLAAETAYGFDRTGWTWQRSVSPGAHSGFVRLHVDPEIFDQSTATLDDLRVVDSSDKLVPHVVHRGRTGRQSRLELPAVRLLDETFVPERYVRVTLDFEKPVQKNRIEVELSGVNYRRRALLEASSQGEGWETVAEDLWLFDVSLAGRRFRADTLSFPSNTFRYLRLTVYNMPDDPRRISVVSVKGVLHRTYGERELVPVFPASLHSRHDTRSRQSVFEMDLGHRNLPVFSVKWNIGTPYFHRGYELLGRNDTVEKVVQRTETGQDIAERTVSWKALRTGVLHRTREGAATSACLVMEDLSAPYRYLQLRVFNGDDPPLHLQGAEVLRRDTRLVFAVRPGETYTLIGGNPKAGPPAYDLSRAVAGVDTMELPVVHAGPAVSIAPAERAAPWSERHGGLLLLGLVLAVGVTVFYVVRSLRGVERGAKHPPP